MVSEGQGSSWSPGRTNPLPAQVEANNTVTSGTATTVVEIQIQPSPTGEPPKDPRLAGGGPLAGDSGESKPCHWPQAPQVPPHPQRRQELPDPRAAPLWKSPGPLSPLRGPPRPALEETRARSYLLSLF